MQATKREAEKRTFFFVTDVFFFLYSLPSNNLTPEPIEQPLYRQSVCWGKIWRVPNLLLFTFFPATFLHGMKNFPSLKEGSNYNKWQKFKH